MEQKKACKNKRIIVVVLAAAVALTVLLILLLRGGGDGLRGIAVQADYVDDSHISLSGIFTVTGAEKTDVELLASRLEMEPGMEFALQPDEQTGALQLRTFLPLEAGVPVAVLLKDAQGGEEARWEFVAEDSFRVLNHFPAAGGMDVPPSSAVEITFSSSDIDEESLGDYIAVSPAIAVDLSLRGQMVVITPKERIFPAATTFQVVVSGELPRQEGGVLGDDYRFSFTTGQEEGRDYRLSSNWVRVSENVPAGDAPLLKLQLGDALQGAPLTTTVYRYRDAEEYRDALRSYRDAAVAQEYSAQRSYSSANDYWQANTDGLEEVMKFVAPAGTTSEMGTDYYVALPEPLQAGWYAARVEVELPSGAKRVASKLIQVGPFAVYTAQLHRIDDNGNGKLVAWVNSSKTGGPLKNAEISVSAWNYNVQSKTDGDGLAALEGKVGYINRSQTTSDDIVREDVAAVYGLLTVRHGNEVFYDISGSNSNYYFQDGNRHKRFYTYLFSDRPVYRHNDTVKVWGLVKPRKEGDAIPQGLYLTMADGAYTVPISPGADGAFQAEFDLAGMSGDYLQIALGDDNGTFENDYYSLNVELKDYVKPVYQTAVELQKPVYTAWENDGEVEVRFSAAYYEGTPAREYEAVVRKQDKQSTWRPGLAEVALSTDSDGLAQVELTPDEPEDERYRDSWRPQQVDFGVFSDEELNTPQVQGGSFNYLYRDTMLLMEKSGDRAVTVAVNRIDTSRIGSKADLLIDENLRGEPVETTLTAEVHKVYYEKIADGERYDAINKQSATAYRSEYTDKVVETIAATSSGGSHTFSDLPLDDKFASYYLKVIATDSRGKRVTESLYYNEVSEDWWPGGGHNFKFVKNEKEPLPALLPGEYYDPKFRDGEQLEICFTDMGEEVSAPAGRLLYLLYQEEILDYAVTAAGRFALPYDEQYIPNYRMCGAYFDGKYIYATNYTEILYDPALRELQIETEPAQGRYAPGETAAVTFQVTDQNSEPVAGATLVASVVDEAVFAIREQQPKFLQSLYRQVSSAAMTQYTSYDNHDTGSDGRGGGGPDAFVPRTDFEDTAAFEVLTTDEGGRAELSVALPDNLTSWRVTTLALSDEGQAGDSKDSFSVSKDFFVTPVLPPRLLAGDDLVFTLRAAGAGTGQDDVVRYTCMLEGLGESVTIEGRAGDFTPVVIPANSLPDVAEYRLTVRGESAAGNDAVEATLQVVASGLDATVTRQLPLAQLSAVKSTTWPVTVGFYDREHALEAEILDYLATHEGARADQRLARRSVMERLRDTGYDAALLDSSVFTDTLAEFCPERQYYRIFSYAQDSALLSARIKLAMGEEGEFRAYPLENPEIEIPQTASPADRAALYLMYSDNDYFGWMPTAVTKELASGAYSFADKMHLVAALARTGKVEQAAEWYGELAVLQEQRGANGERLLSAAPDGQADSTATAAACIAASAIAHPDAPDLVRSLLAASASDEPYLLELVYFLRQQPQPAGSVGRVSFTRDGKETIDLQGGVQYRSFSREQLVGAGFEASGDVGVSVRCTAAPGEAFAAAERLLVLGKTIEAADGGTLRQGRLAKVTLHLEVPPGVALQPQTSMTIEDYVPTGMRYDSTEPQTGWYLSAQNDQRVTFLATLETAGTLVYYARCVAPGSYVGEGAVVSPAGGRIWGQSPPVDVDIAP